MNTLSIWYGVGAGLVLAFKLVRYLYHGRNMGKAYKTLLGEWFIDGGSKENAVSWGVTIGIVWAFGFLYVGNYALEGAEFIDKIPDVPAFAFLLGGLMEKYAPDAAKWILSKLPRGGGS